MEKNTERVFFALQILSEWPSLPTGRILKNTQRHMTLAFLGTVKHQEIEQVWKLLPPLPFCIGPSGYFDTLLFLPEKKARVAAFRAAFLEKNPAIFSYQKTLISYLREKAGFTAIDNRHPFLPHVTVARKPFSEHNYLKSFCKKPFISTHLHLYKSDSNLNYSPIYSQPLQSAFSEIAHTADIAFIIRGNSISQLYQNAFLALSSFDNTLLDYYQNIACTDITEVVIALNTCVAMLDEKQGSQIKAVSFHGDIIEQKNHLEWEMIVDI